MGDQRKNDQSRERQEETNGRILGELSTTRQAAIKASEAAVKAVTIVEQLDKKWDRKHEELAGRVALLENDDDGGGGSEPPRSVLPSYDDDMFSEATQNDVLASADKNGVLAAFIQERRTTSTLNAKVAALEATIRERDRQSDRVRAETRQQRGWRFAWWKLVLGAVVTLAGGAGGAVALLNALHGK
jgi:hypothetical protein